jgi:hypothetical protein
MLGGNVDVRTRLEAEMNCSNCSPAKFCLVAFSQHCHIGRGCLLFLKRDTVQIKEHALEVKIVCLSYPAIVYQVESLVTRASKESFL